MHKWYHIFSKNTGLGMYTWIMFCMLPFYFVFRLSSWVEISIGLLLMLLFFTAYRFAFVKHGWIAYLSLSIGIAISVGLTLYFGYVYFALFLAYFIGNSKSKPQFISLYVVNLVLTIAAVIVGFIFQSQLFLTQLPFMIVTLIAVILLPLNMFHTNKEKQLESELQSANERISRLLVAEERHRIARDLHDTLGQKLSLIVLKSDLSGKLVGVAPEKAVKEINDVKQTARTALKELREIVSTMQSIKLKDELERVQQVLSAAQIDYIVKGDFESVSVPPLVEHVLSMCLKESVTNIVKHSGATTCHIAIKQTEDGVVIEVEDNGIGIPDGQEHVHKGSGLRGMMERLDFINGNLTLKSQNGTKVIIRVPKVIVQS